MAKGKANREKGEREESFPLANNVPASSSIDASPRSQNHGFPVNRGTLVGTIHQYSGPLPDPRTLAEFERICPGAAKIILNRFVSQGEHRQQLENMALASEIRNSGRGLVFGLIIGLAAIGGATACILMGHEWGGSLLGAGGFSGLVGVFVYGSRSRRKERQDRLRIQLQGTPENKDEEKP